MEMDSDVLMFHSSLSLIKIDIYKVREMVSFELGKKIEKDVFFVLSRAWGEEKNLSPYQELNPRPLDSAREVQKIPPEQVLG